MQLETALAMCGGAARWERLREFEVSAYALRQSDLAIGGGSYALPHAPAPIVAAVRLNGVVSHATAAALHGFGLWRAVAELHVTVPSWRPPERGVKLHRARLLSTDLDPFQPLTAPLRTALDCGRSLPLLEAVVVLDSATHSGRVRLEALKAAAEVARGHGAAALRQAVRFVDALADSPLESVLRLLVTLLPCHVSVQVRVRGAGKVDIVLDGWLVLEADGFEHHSDRKAYREDRRRANVLPRRRLVLLRYSWEDLRFRPWEVLAQIEEVLRLGPPWVATQRQGCKS
jgi:very-short-patch-repair endonuclease